LFTAAVQAQDSFQLFGGYSYLRPSVAVTENLYPPSCPVGVPCVPVVVGTHPNLNGWELSGTYNAYKWLGATADFSGHYGSVLGSSVHLQTFLFGPQIRFPGRVSPFAHVLFGGAHESLGGNSSLAISSGSASAFAVAVGAGIDIKVAHFVSLRAIQLDYLMTRFGSATQNQPRVSAGVVFHF
jgi:opacity protein-like surface antigen